MDVETRIGTEMAQRALWLGPLIVFGTGLLWGGGAALAAVLGVVLSVASFWTTGWVLSWSARRSPQVLGAAALGGFLVRLIALTALVWVALTVLRVHAAGLLTGLGVTYVSLLVLQARRELVRS